MRVRWLLLSAALAGPAVAGAPRPLAQAYFEASGEAVSATISGACMDRGFTVVAADARQVQCSMQMSGFKGALAQFLIGNSYSTTPTDNLRFQLVPWNTGTRVQVSEWIETQMAFGQVQRQPLDGRKQIAAQAQMLYNLGGTGIPAVGASPVIPGQAVTTTVTREQSVAPPLAAADAPGTIDLGGGVKLKPAKTLSGYCILAAPGYQGTGAVNRPVATSAKPVCS